MTSAKDVVDEQRLSPQQALSILGNETRLGILQLLGRADGSLTFSELYQRSESDSTANFSYHLGELNGRFIEQTDEGYVIRQAGKRVVEAVLAEAVPEELSTERTAIDWPCFLCGNPVEMSYHLGHVGLYCSNCGGTRDGQSRTGDGRLVERADILGIMDLPPAGTVGREPREIVEFADYWTTLEALALAREMCPRCSATLEVSVTACSNHDDQDQVCQDCGQRFAITVNYDCQNCIFNVESPIGTYLFDNPNLRSFMLDHGIDPFDSAGFHFHALEETVRNHDPLSADLKYSIDGDSIEFTVDGELNVTMAASDGPDVTSHSDITE